jgi:hypothetical protein
MSELKYCNCAWCGRLLLGLSCGHLRYRIPSGQRPPVVSRRINDRPYCPRCVRTAARLGLELGGAPVGRGQRVRTQGPPL